MIIAFASSMLRYASRHAYDIDADTRWFHFSFRHIRCYMMSLLRDVAKMKRYLQRSDIIADTREG